MLQDYVPCPDEAILLPSRVLVQHATESVTAVASGHPEYLWTILAMFAGLAVYGLLDFWLWKKGQPTITVLNRNGPKWVKFLVAGSLTALIWHLFFQGRSKPPAAAAPDPSA